MRLRSLSEAECYTRCYGGRRGERVSLVKIVARTAPGERKPVRHVVRPQERAA